MKNALLFGCVTVCAAASFGSVCVSPEPEDVRVGGYLGGRLDACLAKNIKATDGIYLSDVFKRIEPCGSWQTEFWGKWMHSAVPLWRYAQHDATLKASIDASVKNVLSAQRPDGYIGDYKDTDQLKDGWDIWGRKYTILGLLHYYDGTKDAAALQAARRVADHLMTQVGPGLADIYKTGGFRGMPSCSVLEPIVWLYNRTKDPKYLKFADYIVAQMDAGEEAPGLVAKGLKGIDVASRFPHPEPLHVWWSWKNGMKAYEMMSCYQGLAEYYEATGKKECLDAAVATARNIAATEINAAGSGASYECFYHGKARQVYPAYATMETCVTITWMRLCEKLLRLTHDPLFADAFEQALYNAYLAALQADGSIFVKYTPLDGFRGPGENQCKMRTNCCNANGARGFVALLETLVMADADTVYVNLYTPAAATLTRGPGGPKVTIAQTTDYPASGAVKVAVSPAEPAEFAVAFRIPVWSAKTSAAVNGEPVKDVKPGAYLTLKRMWKPGDIVTLSFDMAGRGELNNHHLAIHRGPLTLCRDTRFADGNVLGVVEPAGRGLFDLKPAKPLPGCWLAFTLPMRLGVNREIPAGQAYSEIHLCDFASAGNTWGPDSLYCTWLPVPLSPVESEN